VEKTRMEAFSDGVFAIAITLLVLDLRVPEVGDGSLAHALVRQWPADASYAVSFLTIGIIWINHHGLMRHIDRCDRVLLSLNIFLLMMIAVCIPLAFVLGNRLDVPLHDGRALGLALLAGIFGAGVPSVLFLIGIRAIGGTRAGILMLIEPLVGVTLAAIVLHEALLPIQVVGGAAILGAALLLQRGGPGDRPEPGLVAVAEHT